VNFSGGDNTKVECELPGDHTRRGEVEGGLPHDPTFTQGETSSVLVQKHKTNAAISNL